MPVVVFWGGRGSCGRFCWEDVLQVKNHLAPYNVPFLLNFLTGIVTYLAGRTLYRNGSVAPALFLGTLVVFLGTMCAHQIRTMFLRFYAMILQRIETYVYIYIYMYIYIYIYIIGWRLRSDVDSGPGTLPI